MTPADDARDGLVAYAAAYAETHRTKACAQALADLAPELI